MPLTPSRFTWMQNELLTLLLKFGRLPPERLQSEEAQVSPCQYHAQPVGGTTDWRIIGLQSTRAHFHAFTHTEA